MECAPRDNMVAQFIFMGLCYQECRLELLRLSRCSHVVYHICCLLSSSSFTNVFGNHLQEISQVFRSLVCVAARKKKNKLFCGPSTSLHATRRATWRTAWTSPPAPQHSHSHGCDPFPRDRKFLQLEKHPSSTKLQVHQLLPPSNQATAPSHQFAYTTASPKTKAEQAAARCTLQGVFNYLTCLPVLLLQKLSLF